MKKIIALLLTVIMVLMLAGCGSDDEKTENSNAKTEQNNESKEEKKDDSKNEKQETSQSDNSTSAADDSTGKGWPAEKIAEMASVVHATVPELKAENVSYEEMNYIGKSLYINSDNITSDDSKEWLAALAEQGFVRSLGLVSNSAFKVEGKNKFSVSVMGADGSYIVTISLDELEETAWPYYQLKTAFGENFSLGIFDASGLFSGLTKDYVWSYDPDTSTVTCDEADDDLENYVRDLASSTYDYFDDTKYVKYMFLFAIDESKTEGKQMECYISRDGSKMTVHFELAEHVE